MLDESKKQLQANIAARDAARATVQTAEANEGARKAEADKAQADVFAARAKAKVARAAEQRLTALLSYTRMTAPYDGIVVDRNANTGDYVQPGEQSGSRGKPVYVVARTDKVRVYVDVPEMDANLVSVGTKAKVQVQALDDAEIEAAVTRTSWALHPQIRTLRAEIDLPNSRALLLPGMYAYGRLFLERRNVRALPLDTVIQIGNVDCCYLYDNGKAVQTPVQTGINDGKWIEVIKKQANGDSVPFTGTEEVIQGDLSELSDGLAVQVIGAATPKPAQAK